MSIKNRITQPQGYLCPVIQLTDAEKKAHYTGAGLKIARFENGELQGFFDPLTLPYNADTEAAANEALHAAIAWLANAKDHGETWLVMCSGGELCDPEPVDILSAAKIGRAFGDMFARLFD